MKYLYGIFLLFFINCYSIKEIPSPLKGSYENPISISGHDKVKQCIEKFKTKYSLKIKYINSILGINFVIVDIFSFPYKKWYITKFKNNDTSDIPDEYYFYINSYGTKNECEQDIEEILEFP